MSDKPKRRWYQFSITTMMGLTGAAGIACGIFANWDNRWGIWGLLLLLALIPFFIVRAFLLWATGLLFRDKDNAP